MADRGLQVRPHHRLLLRDRPRDRRAPRRARLHRLRHRAPRGGDRRPRGARLPRARARRHRRGVDAGGGRGGRRPSRARSARSSTTPATASRARSRKSRWRDVRRQFETNVFGLVRMCQLVLPGMRAQRHGRIVNVSSMGANFTFPGGGFYHATKYAVEAISDALRFEVKGFGIDVVDRAAGDHPHRLRRRRDRRDPRGDAGRRPVRPVQRGGRGLDAERLRARAARPPRRRARDRGAHDRAGDHRASPKIRYRVTPSARLLVGQRALMTDGMWDRMLASQFPRPGDE